ncbi:Histidine kinase [Hydrobacter penzbergensis]|uniref:Histidine kinase n=1 Tax=Hydrobacter penzbergensis TaxID=1235997 RepID=A0A8X8IFD5_9BACT|nr:histidine kinase [Hydrobacter penzbergensis]SDW40288.1 Histidine kinase [Hydrobacter penzbergensis]
MKFFWKYLFPGCYGLLVYITLRILDDSITGFKFWQRDWRVNAIEITCCIIMSFVTVFIFRKMLDRFDRKLSKPISYKTVMGELGWVFLYVLVSSNAIFTPMAALTDDGLSWGDFATINIIPLLFSLIYYMVVRSNKLLQAYVDNQLQLEKMTNDQLQTELKFLKAQYHPHFLFNALNTIYFQMDESVADAKKSIEKFSGLLRYQLYDQQQMVPIKQEIDYLRNFIELQQARSSERLRLQVDFDEHLNGEQVYPLLFLPLIENAFKYVGGNYHLSIRLQKENDNILLEVCNSLPEHLPVKKIATGIGIENLRRRLALLYPGKHQLSCRRNNDNYTASLNLLLS